MKNITPIQDINAIILNGNDMIRATPLKQETISADEARQDLKQKIHIGCHIPTLYQKIRTPPHKHSHLDIAELFAFIHPTQFVLPTYKDIAQAVTGNTHTSNHPHQIIDVLLQTLKNQKHHTTTDHIAQFMHENQWAWAPYILSVLNQNNNNKNGDIPKHTALPQITPHIKEWKETYPQKQHNTHQTITKEDAETTLRHITEHGSIREQQCQYTKTVTEIFQPNKTKTENNIQLLEAGTGLGKTLAYLIPAHLQSQKINTPIWISTYTKNLQRQILNETKKLLQNDKSQENSIIIRKGNENYLCLQKMENITAKTQTLYAQGDNILLALITQWAIHSQDGDLSGHDFLSWIVPLIKHTRKKINPLKITDLTLNQGECTAHLCPHFKKCFIFKSKNKAKNAKIIIANHALILSNARNNQDNTTQNEDKNHIPKYIIFDEGHHIFNAVDNATATHLTQTECQKIKTILLQYEIRSQAQLNTKNMLKNTLITLNQKQPNIKKYLNQMSDIIRQFPDKKQSTQNPAQNFFNHIYHHVTQYDQNRQEAPCENLLPECVVHARQFQNHIETLNQIIKDLIAEIHKATQNNQNTLDEQNKNNKNYTETLINTLEQNQNTIQKWIRILKTITEPSAEENQEYFQWCFIQENQNKKKHPSIRDVGIHRHALDPTKIFAESILKHVTGAVITSATLKDTKADIDENWDNAEIRTGAIHLPWVVTRKHFESPFNYKKNAQFIVVTDVNHHNPDTLALAYQKLFCAAKGSALGLFTAITRLKNTYQKIAAPLNQNGITLYAQHIDPIDTATLVEMFQNDITSCILGTDALRDGINVPGESLRLIVMEKVPWARPTLLEKKRQAIFPKWQDINVRLKLRQAFGRLIRTEHDTGIFILLDNRYNTRFDEALPKGVIPKRMTLQNAIQIVENCNRTTEYNSTTHKT